MTGIAHELAEYIVSLKYEDLPQDTIDMAKKCILDSVGNMCCGRYSNMGKHILRYIDTYSRATRGERKVSLMGGGKASKEDSMMAHTIMARCTDLDDGHRYAMGHPGSVVLPAVLTAGELRNSGGKDIITAIVAGYDIYCRIGSAINPSSYRERGFDATGVCGAAACAAGIGKIYGLDVRQMKNALGLSSTFSGGLIEYQNDGTMGKVLCGCWAVNNGMDAVQLAEQGFTGPEQIFEGDKGFFQAFSNAPDASNVLAGLGRDFKINETYFKQHACMRGLHGAVDALLDIRKKEGITAKNVDRIEIQTTSFVGRLSNPRPDTLIGAQCSIEFVLAVAMAEGHISSDEILLQSMEREDIRHLASRIILKMDKRIDGYVKENPSHWAAVNMIIYTTEGRVFKQWMPLPRGESETPFGWEELEEKFKRLLSDTPFHKHEEAMYGDIRNFEELTGMYKLFAPWETEGSGRKTSA